jgi:hypothetical protein
MIMTYQVDYSKCPSKHMEHSVRLYVEHGIKPGSFLQAVLANDLIHAATRADSSNAELLREWVFFLLGLPDECWGSWKKVVEWKGLNHERSD